MGQQIGPVRMHPAFRGGKLTPWGGERLKTVFGKEISEVPTGESLEISCIPGLESRDDGGRKLTELIEEYGEAYVGRYAGKAFPLLLKLIDAREPLSVQVHPDDAYAGENEGGKLGKTEAWLILDCPEGAELVYGIQPGTDPETLERACEQGSTVAPLLRRVKVRPGDVCNIPAGTVHAIGAGILLYEIQQSSDVTYRFYDWDRVDQQGKRRELHIRKALDVTKLTFAPEPKHWDEAPGVTRMLEEPYFSLDLIRQNKMELSELVTDNDVVAGSKVVTSYISDKYLPGILIGYVDTIKEDANHLQKTGTVIPAVDFRHITDVLVIQTTKRTADNESADGEKAGGNAAESVRSTSGAAADSRISAQAGTEGTP